MSQLKFKGHPDHRVPRPNSYFLGQFPQYLGFARREDGTLEPTEFTIDDTTPAGQRLLKLARRDGCFVPADETAARAIGVEFKVPAKVVKANG